MAILKSPFPYFGGKSKISKVVWDRFGSDIPNLVEPFFGSGAVLLARPDWTPDKNFIETVNDKDGLVSNFWRAIQAAPDDVAKWADWPVNENDLHARHLWLLGKKDGLSESLMADPDYFDAKVAGWWVWGMCSWIGSGWCSGNGPWQNVDGKLVKVDGEGVKIQRPHLGDAGMGINRKLPHLGDAGKGINRQLPHQGNAGNNGVMRKDTEGIYSTFRALSARLRRVRVCSGEWARVCGPTPTVKNGLTAVFLDPPYSLESDRQGDLYRVDDLDVAHDVRRWAISVGDDPMMRIALCGYESEHDEDINAAGWECVAWKAKGGYGSQGQGRGRDNAGREVVWFSPHCKKELKLL